MLAWFCRWLPFKRSGGAVVTLRHANEWRFTALDGFVCHTRSVRGGQRRGFAHFFINPARIGTLHGTDALIGFQHATNGGWWHHAGGGLQRFLRQDLWFGAGKFFTLALTQLAGVLGICRAMPATVDVGLVKAFAHA